MNKRVFWTYCRGYTYFSSIAGEFDTWGNHARAACTDVRRMHHYPKHHENCCCFVFLCCGSVSIQRWRCVRPAEEQVLEVFVPRRLPSRKPRHRTVMHPSCILEILGRVQASWLFRLRDSLHNYNCWTLLNVYLFLPIQTEVLLTHFKALGPWAVGWLLKLFTFCRWKLTPLEGVGQLCAGPLANHFSFLGCESAAWNRGKLQRGHSETLTMSLTVRPVTPWICAAGIDCLAFCPRFFVSF